MSIEVSPGIEVRLAEAAQRQGVSVDALLGRMLDEPVVPLHADRETPPRLPVLHLGPTGSLRRADIYEDVR